MARTYKRDARGRFAGSGGSSRGTSGPGSKPRGSVTAKGRGTAAARNRLAKSQQKLAANATPAQRGAVTRAKNKLQTAKANNTSKLNIKPSTKGGVMKGRVARNPQAGAKLAGAGRVKVNREPKTKAQILSQTRRIVEKASARKEKSLLSHVRVKNDRRIAKATAVRQAIINPPKPKPKKRDANRLTPTQIVNRRMLASQDAWNRGMRGH